VRERVIEDGHGFVVEAVLHGAGGEFADRVEGFVELDVIVSTHPSTQPQNTKPTHDIRPIIHPPLIQRHVQHALHGLQVHDGQPALLLLVDGIEEGVEPRVGVVFPVGRVGGAGFGGVEAVGGGGEGALAEMDEVGGGLVWRWREFGVARWLVRR
jgi:hypothetical protein